MKKIENELKEIISVIDGKLLLIGNYSNKIKELITNNEKILSCDELTNNTISDEGTNKTKKINIKKIKKIYKKNKLNSTIVDFEEVKEYKNTFIRDSSYITKKQILVIDKNNNVSIYKMYKRYCADIKIIECLDGRIFKINSSNSKNNIIKNIIYYIIDVLTDTLEIISNLL